MSESLSHKNNQPQFASSPLLPDEQVLWEGDARGIFERIWITFGLITGVFIFFGIVSPSWFWVLIIFYVLTLIGFSIILFVESMIAPKYHYRLTSKEMIVVKRGFSEETTISFKFSLLLAVELKESGFLPHIRLVSPDGDIPSRLYLPPKSSRDLSEALIPLWQTSLLEADAEERLKLQRLYNPPWKPWIKYSLFTGLFGVISFLLWKLPSIFKWDNPWNGIFQFFILFLAAGTLYGRAFAPMFLGKDFKYNTRVSPKHFWFQMALLLLIFIPIIIFSPR